MIAKILFVERYYRYLVSMYSLNHKKPQRSLHGMYIVCRIHGLTQKFKTSVIHSSINLI